MHRLANADLRAALKSHDEIALIDVREEGVFSRAHIFLGSCIPLSQLEFLRSCNCDLAQGYLISRPIQAEKVSAVLRSEIAGTRLLARGMP